MPASNMRVSSGMSRLLRIIPAIAATPHGKLRLPASCTHCNGTGPDQLGCPHPRGSLTPSPASWNAPAKDGLERPEQAADATCTPDAKDPAVPRNPPVTGEPAPAATVAWACCAGTSPTVWRDGGEVPADDLRQPGEVGVDAPGGLAGSDSPAGRVQRRDRRRYQATSAASSAPSSQQASRSSLPGGPMTHTGGRTARHCRPPVIASTARTAPVVSMPPCTYRP